MSEEGYMLLQIGPQHPGSGHMRMLVKLDGDVIVDFIPDVGYVHRTVEKIAETKLYIQNIPLLEKPILNDSGNANLAYITAVEKLLDVEPPPRARYLRTIMAELSRIASHLYGIGILSILMGSSTGFMWAFGDREIFIHLMQMLSGARITYSYMVPGGVRRDLPDQFREEFRKAARYMRRRYKDYEKIIINNPVTRARLEGVGVLPREKAIEWGTVGPNLRASGVAYDVRKVEPYAAYEDIDFEIAVRKEGDCYARLLVRFQEIMESLRIIEQALEKIPDGKILAEKYEKMIQPRAKKLVEGTGRIKFPAIYVNLKPPKGEVFSRVESGKGEITVYLVSNGSPKPYRLRFVTPSFRNLLTFKNLIPGHRLADFPAIYGSLDYFPPGADR